MKPTILAGIIAAITFATPAQAQDKPAENTKQETKDITININTDETKKGGESKTKIKIVRKINGKEEVIEREFSGDMPADLQEKLKDMNGGEIGSVLINRSGDKAVKTNKSQKITIYSGDCKGADKQDMNFDFMFKLDEKAEIPAEIKKMMEEKGLNKDGKFIFITGDKAGKQTMTNVYKSGDGKEVKVFIFKSCNIEINSDQKRENPASAEAGKAETLEPQLTGLNVYPNPNDGQFNLKFKLEEKGDAHITLHDDQGNILFEEKLKDFSGEYEKPIRIDSQKEGVYILKIIQNGKTYNRRVMVK